MSETKRNPVIRVYEQSRRKLKMLAVHYGETMQDTVERLAQAEIERIQKGGKTDEENIQIPPLSNQDD